jgi:hypothetical protein
VPTIFISYRRSDSEMAAGRLRDALVLHFGDEQIFRDKEVLLPGVDWRDSVGLALGEPTTVVLALIGAGWVSEQGRDGQRLIDDIDNANRFELESALSGGLPTIPVLVGNTQMPHANELPEALRALTRINAVRLRDDDWTADIRRVIAALEERGVKPGSGQPSDTSGGVALTIAKISFTVLARSLVLSLALWYAYWALAGDAPTSLETTLLVCIAVFIIGATTLRARVWQPQRSRRP